MPLPRKNFRGGHVHDGKADEDVIFPGRTKQLFDWDEMGLGLGVDLSSSGSEGSRLGVKKHGNHELDPKGARKRDVDRETFEWVRSLVAARKAKHQSIATPTALQSSRGWLSDQHAALKSGTVPVTSKCILAASGVSRTFNKFREEFRRPEYRSRYWDWSSNFILLIDYFVENGDINVTDKAPQKYKDLLGFIANCKRQKLYGKLSGQRDQLLTALGMKWDVEKPLSEKAEEEDLLEVSSAESNEDEDWELPSGKDTIKRTCNGPRKASTRKKSRFTASRESARTRAARSKTLLQNPSQSPSLPPHPIFSPPPKPTRHSLKQWAQNIVELRPYYRKHGGIPFYDIPPDKASLRIWMNAEVARTSTGALGSLCCGILKASEMIDASDPIYLESDVELWTKGFVNFVDYTLHPKKLSNQLVDFMFECRAQALNGTMAYDHAALLSGVDDGWQDSKSMRTCMHSCQRRKSDRTKSLRLKRVAVAENDPLDEPDVEIVLDSGSAEGESSAKRKRRKTAKIVTQKLSSMIGGEVAVTVEGRVPTAAEKDAREWILRANAKTFDIYGRTWFRAAMAQKDRDHS